MIAVFVVGLVVIGGLAGLGQANHLGEKGREQILADFYLRAEVEALRSLSWSEIEARSAAVSSESDERNTFLTQTADSLDRVNMSAETKAAQLNANGERGRHIFHLTVSWNDRTGNVDEESRVLVVAEGGISAR